MANSYAAVMEEAIEAYERAIAAAPGDPRGYAALADLAGGEEGIALLRDAAERTFGDPQFSLRLGIELASVGRTDDAMRAWGRAVALRPGLLRQLPYERTGITMDRVADEAMLTLEREPRPGPVEQLREIADLGLALDALPPEAGPAWLAVDAARDGDMTAATAFAEEAIAEAPYDARGYQALAAVAAFACDDEGEREALEIEARTRDPYAPVEAEPHPRREFIYREASLGPSQPPGATPGIEIERWPWPLVERPECRS
jgi:tetratricopeptide (TPR) repeat protein